MVERRPPPNRSELSDPDNLHLCEGLSAHDRDEIDAAYRRGEISEEMMRELARLGHIGLTSELTSDTDEAELGARVARMPIAKSLIDSETAERLGHIFVEFGSP